MTLKSVMPDPIPGQSASSRMNGPIAWQGMEYPACTNSLGAVAVILAGNYKLGVKPDEFEVTEFYPQEA